MKENASVPLKCHTRTIMLENSVQHLYRQAAEKDGMRAVAMLMAMLV